MVDRNSTELEAPAELSQSQALAIVQATGSVPEIIDPELSNSQKMALAKKTFARDLSDAEFYLLITEAQHRGLDVFKREYTAIKFKGVTTNMPTIHGVRKMAEMSGLYDGSHGPEWCDASGRWVDVWLKPEPPAAARFKVFRKDRSQPTTAVVTFRERAQYNASGQLMANWATMPAHMIGKVAETDALKKSGLLAASDIPNIAIDPDDDGRDMVTETDRLEMMRRAHAIAKDTGGHATVRATVQAINPEITSVAQADALTLQEAGDLIQTFGDRAAAVVAADDAPADGAFEDADGINEREAWEIGVREIYESADVKVIRTLPVLCEGELWRIESVIRLAPTEAMVNILRREFLREGMAPDEFDNLTQTRRDARRVIGERGVRRAREAQASGTMPARGEYSRDELLAGDAPIDSTD